MGPFMHICAPAYSIFLHWIYFEGMEHRPPEALDLDVLSLNDHSQSVTEQIASRF